jgi:hypothetical protein
MPDSYGLDIPTAGGMSVRTEMTAESSMAAAVHVGGEVGWVG